MLGHSFSRGPRLHSPRSLHGLYWLTVTSVRSMQYAESVTWCAGCSSFAASFSSVPMKNLPPGTSAMPPGHVGAGGGAEADAGTGGVALALASGGTASL